MCHFYSFINLVSLYIIIMGFQKTFLKILEYSVEEVGDSRHWWRGGESFVGDFEAE